MPPVAYAGALQPKKKSELQEIAVALRLSDQGTKDEIQARIKKHLDAHQDDLEDDPTFTGLFGRRKRSVQPQPSAPPSSRFAPDSDDHKPRSIGRRSVAALDAVAEATPAKDMRDVSMFLKQPFSPASSTPTQSPRQVDVPTPSSLPPLPPSPAKSIIEHLPKPSEVKAVVQHQVHQQHQQILQNSNELLIALRGFLSNSQNIWSLTVCAELLYILTATVPWKTVQIPVTSTAKFGLTYAPANTIVTPAFWQVLIHWAIPGLILPALFGCLISFNPALKSPAPPKDGSAPSPALATPLDPLTAAIVRVASAVAYPYTPVGRYFNVIHLDVVGREWRVFNASLGLAFAFAELISTAPVAAAKAASREQQLVPTHSSDDREPTPARAALMSAEDADREVD